jgi:hypothetical protein
MHVPLEGLAGESSWAGESEWVAGPEAEELTDALRSAMREEYADASDEAMYDALEAVLGSMSPAEAFNFSRALNQAAQGATKLVKDPTFIQVASTAAPIVGGLIGGPVGAGLGALASNALLSGAAPPPSSPRPASPPPTSPSPPAPPPAALSPLSPAPPPAVPAAAPPAPLPVAAAQPPVTATATAPGIPLGSAPELPPPALGSANSLAGGSTAAAKALVLTQQSDVLLSLVATALGRHGCRRVSGVPVAHVLALIGQVLWEAAADADQMMYTEQQADSSEGASGEVAGGSYRSLYADLIGADNIELFEAAEREGLI